MNREAEMHAVIEAQSQLINAQERLLAIPEDYVLISERHLEAMIGAERMQALKAGLKVGRPCGRINGGHPCTLPAGSNCPDCKAIHDVPEGS
jgi:hypothetical protein